MWTVTAVATAHCARKVREQADPARIPLMGVTGAFTFAAQMLNFTIPGTGSSGHLGGGLMLAILLGPEAAFLVISSVLVVQALFFADGGLLALGCNLFNLGVIPAFIAYPLIYRRIAGPTSGPVRLTVAAVAGATFAVVAGALAVVGETTASQVSALPFGAFAALMLPIHAVIGLVEGAVTAVVIGFVHRTQPDMLAGASSLEPSRSRGRRKVVVVLAACALIAAGGLSWFASSNPDGLEWSIARLGGIQQGADKNDAPDEDSAATGPAVDPATGAAGIIGGVVTLLLASGAGVVLTRRARRADSR